MTTTRPRSKAAKTTEATIDTTLISGGVVFAFAILRQRYNLDPGVEAAGVAFVTGLVAGLVRLVRVLVRERSA